MRTTRFRNNHHQICSSQRIGKSNNLEAFGAEISKSLNRIAKIDLTTSSQHIIAVPITIHVFFRVFSGQQLYTWDFSGTVAYTTVEMESIICLLPIRRTLLILVW